MEEKKLNLLKKGSHYLNSNKVRQSETIVEGRNPVYEALRGRREIKKIYIDRSISKNLRLRQISNLAKDKSIPIEFVDKSFLNKFGFQHQGVIAKTSAYKYYSLQYLLKEIKNKKSIIVILDRIKDPQNLGAILRTCHAFSIEGVLIPERRSAKITSAVCRASTGACEHLKIAKIINLRGAVDKLKENGFWVMGTSDRADELLSQVEIPFPLAIVMGSEQKGISRILLDSCDLIVRIKTTGEIPSLNVSVATGIVLYEVMKKLRKL